MLMILSNKHTGICLLKILFLCKMIFRRLGLKMTSVTQANEYIYKLSQWHSTDLSISSNGYGMEVLFATWLRACISIWVLRRSFTQENECKLQILPRIFTPWAKLPEQCWLLLKEGRGKADFLRNLKNWKIVKKSCSEGLWVFHVWS